MNSLHHKKRLASEVRFRALTRGALWFAIAALVLLMTTLIHRGWSGFLRTEIRLDIQFDQSLLELQPGQPLADAPPANFQMWAQESLKSWAQDNVTPAEKRQLFALLSRSAGRQLRAMAIANPALLGTKQTLWLPASSLVDLYAKGKIDVAAPESHRRLKDLQILWIDHLREQGHVRTVFNDDFFTRADSREAEQAGFRGAIVGSLWTMLVCMLVVFPLGVATAVYLEEFARKSRWTDVVEVNINNLAAVPSIVYGLLGLALYLNVLGMPRSAPLVGGLTLAMMVLPVLIIATRAALRAVPDSIRDAARGLGATPVQVVWHHTLPLAVPGMMTGTILAVARAIGETAPLLMIGMVAFVADVPKGMFSAATAMPVQIYLWATSPEQGFVEKTAAGILVLMAILLVLNATAIFIRKRFEIRW